MTEFQRGGSSRRAHIVVLCLAAFAFALYASKADARPSYGHLLPGCVAMPCDGPMGALPGLFSSVVWEAVGRPQRAGVETGLASYYGGKFHGRKMANGQVFNQWSDSCAHKTRKFGTVLTVTMGNRSVRCVVRDRGPYIRGRIIDLSVAGARDLGLIGRGIGRVSVR